MADQIREVLIKLGLDASDVARVAPEVESSFLGISKSVAAVTAVVGGLTAATAAYIALASRGSAVNDIADGFKRIQEAAGKDAVDGINQLRAATQGLLTDFDLMKQSNTASQLGLSPEQFNAIAGAAKTLGSVAGKELPEALADMTRGFGMAQEKMLTQYGIIVDTEKAERDFAKQLGVTRDQLSELGKKEAFRTAALEEMKKKQIELASSTASVVDGFTRIGVALTNQIDQISKTVSNNGELEKSLNEIARIISEMDVAPIVQGIEAIGAAAVVAAKLVADFVRGLDYLFESSIKAQIVGLDEDIAATEQKINRILNLNSKGQGITFNSGYANAGGPEKKAVDELRVSLADLQKKKSELMATERAALVVTKETTTTTVKTKDAYVSLSKESEALAKKNKELVESFKALEQNTKNSILVKGLGDELQRSLDKFDFSNVDAQIEKLRDALQKQFTDEIPADVKKAMIEAYGQGAVEGFASAKTDAAIKEVAQKVADAHREAFQNSVDFFSDILTPMFDDAAFNLEDVLTDALKRVAIGFGAGLLAQFAQFAGINTAGFGGGAGGLGQWLASALFGGGSSGSSGGGGILSGIVDPEGLIGSALGSLGLESLIGGAAAATAVPAAPVIVSAGWTTGAAGAGAGAAGAGAAGSSMLGTLGPYAAAAAAAYFVLDQTGVLEGNFGGTSDPETMDRRAFRGQLQQTGLGEDLRFHGVRGDVSLFDSDYSLKKRTEYTDEAIGFANPLAAIFAQGDAKKQSDFAGIFADALDDVGSYNELIIQTQGLMEGLGMNTVDVKNQLTGLFLDGKISLDEFNQGIAAMNIAATDNLVGTGSVKDAINILTDALATPRTQLKAVELAFKEMAELGVESSTEVAAYLTENFGPDVAAAFQGLASAGIDSWEDIKNASADQIALIFSLLQPLKSEISGTFQEAADDAAVSFNHASSSIERDFNRIVDQARTSGANINAALTFKPRVDTSPNDNKSPAEFVR